MRQTAPRWQQVGRVRANAPVQAGTSAAADVLNYEAQVFDHYRLRCACCDAIDDLTIDHVTGRNWDGGPPTATPQFRRWLVSNGFPGGYQTLCRPCKASKRSGLRCRIHNPAYVRKNEHKAWMRGTNAEE
jgi:hypothetical protein